MFSYSKANILYRNMDKLESKGTAPKKEKFFMTLLETIDGVDVPIMSTEDLRIDELKANIHKLAGEMLDQDGKFILYDDLDPPPSGEVALKSKREIKPSRKNRLTHRLLGEAPETMKPTDGRERQTLVSIKLELLSLDGERRNFMNVLDILLRRWNANCHTALSDRHVASIVRTLLETDNGMVEGVIENKIGSILAVIDEDTNLIDDNGDVGIPPVVNKPAVIAFRNY